MKMKWNEIRLEDIEAGREELIMNPTQQRIKTAAERIVAFTEKLKLVKRCEDMLFTSDAPDSRQVDGIAAIIQSEYASIEQENQRLREFVAYVATLEIPIADKAKEVLRTAEISFPRCAPKPQTSRHDS